MKIGIMTFWWSEDNYGQILQCYALQKYLRDKGHDAFLISYKWGDDVKASFLLKCIKGVNPINLYNYVKRLKHIKAVKNEQIIHNRFFSEFRKKYIKQTETIYMNYKQLKKDPPLADVYIVGSDQVWRFGDRSLKRDKYKLHAYFLDFGPKSVKRRSYAASWGATDLSKEYRDEIIPLLKNFEFVTVREKSGLRICRECGVTNAEWVCDPTLLLSADKYRKLYDENIVENPVKPYLFLYLLNNDCDFDIESVFDFANKNNLKVVYITGNGIVDDYEKKFATIPEWLSFIDNAEYVVTNSYHCSLFSCLFNKQFCVIPLTNRHSGMNSRLESLFELLDIEDRFLQDNDFTVLTKSYHINLNKIKRCLWLK